ncbi:MAG: TraB/GumN family protein, partial [Crocinitomicaceae bacterium]
EQAKMLMESLGTEMTEYYKMLDLYLADDLNGLSEAMNNSEMSTDSFTENFLNQRNKNWISEIEKLLTREKIFIAVGAGHLPGEFGVIELLRNKGYSVESVK